MPSLAEVTCRSAQRFGEVIRKLCHVNANADARPSKIGCLKCPGHLLSPNQISELLP